MSKVGQGALDAVIAPRRILLSHAQNQFNNFLRQRRPPDVFPEPAVVPVPGNEFTMPAQNCIRSHDAGHLLEHLPPEDLAFDGQTPSLVVAE
jgi:hypothetical protein